MHRMLCDSVGYRKDESSPEPKRPGQGDLNNWETAPRGRIDRRGTLVVKKTRLLRVIDGWMPGSGLSSKARQVLRYMMDKGDSPEVRDDGEMVVRNIYPTKKTMAARLGVSTRTIDRACEELALRGMLAWETLPPKRNRYLLHIPPEVTAEVIGTGQGNDGTDASTGHPDASAGHPDASTRPGDASMRQGDASKDQNPSPESI